MQEYTNCCLNVIKLRFGDLSYQVAKTQSMRGRQNVQELIKGTGLDIEVVCQGLTVLQQHDLIICQEPVTLSHPKFDAKVNVKKASQMMRKRNRSDDSDDDDEDRDIKLITLEEKKDVNTSYFGTKGAGFVRATSEIPAKKFGVYNNIVATTGFATTGGYKHMEYSFNIDMVRGIMRHSEYFSVLQMLNPRLPAISLVLEEFCVRGKLSLEQALRFATERVERDEYHRKLEGHFVEPTPADKVTATSNALLVPSQDQVVTVGTVQSALDWLLSKGFLVQSRGFVDTRVSMSKKVQAGNNSGTPYIINHDRFSLFIRNNLCRDYVCKRLNGLSGYLVGAIMHSNLVNNGTEKFLSTDHISTMLMEYTQYLRHEYEQSPNADTIAEAVSTNPNFIPLTIEEAWQYCNRHSKLSTKQIHELMQTMVHPHIDFVQRRVGVHVTYWLNVDRLCQNVRLEHTHELIRKMVCKDASVIFHVLSDYTRLEEKQISDFALVPMSKTREHLMQLQTLSLVELQDVPKTLDRLPSKSIFLWSLAHARLKETMQNYLYKFYNNTLQKLMADTSKVQTILDKANARVGLTDDEAVVQGKWVKRFAAYDNILTTYAQVLVIFHDVCQ